MADFVGSARETGAQSLTGWCRRSQAVYVAAKHRRLHTEVAKMMGWPMPRRRLPPAPGLAELCQQAKDSGATSISEWSRRQGTQYRQARALGLVADIARHMGWRIRTRRQVTASTFEEFLALARESGCDSRTSFRLSYPGLVSAMRKAGHLETVLKAVWPERKHQHIDLATLIERAKAVGAQGLADWSRKSPGGYQAARRAGLLHAVARELQWKGLR